MVFVSLIIRRNVDMNYDLEDCILIPQRICIEELTVSSMAQECPFQQLTTDLYWFIDDQLNFWTPIFVSMEEATIPILAQQYSSQHFANMDFCLHGGRFNFDAPNVSVFRSPVRSF